MRASQVRVAATLVFVLWVTPPVGAQTSPRSVALTFDDLPANTSQRPQAYGEILKPLVATLAMRGVPAIGFVNEGKLYEDGRPVAERLALLEGWLDAGFDLGNHGYEHLDLHRVQLDRWLEDVVQGERLTRRLLAARGRSLEFFRHPFLHTGLDLATRDSVAAFLQARDVRVAPVTIDNQEWIFARAYERALICRDEALSAAVADAYLAYMDTMFGYYESQTRALVGREIPQVLLLHANALNARHLGSLLDRIERRGYRFVTLDEALSDPAYGARDSYTGTGGITWLHRWAITAGWEGSDFAGEPPVPERVERAYRAATDGEPCVSAPGRR